MGSGFLDAVSVPLTGYVGDRKTILTTISATISTCISNLLSAADPTKIK